MSDKRIDEVINLILELTMVTQSMVEYLAGRDEGFEQKLFDIQERLLKEYTDFQDSLKKDPPTTLN